MEKAFLWSAVAVAFLTIIYLSGRKKDSFVKHFSRGAFMRGLNKKMESDLNNKAP